MEINFTEADIKFRDEVRAFLKDDYPAHVKAKQDSGEALTKEDMIDFHKAVSKKGWMGYNWPVEYGGTGWTSTQIYIFQTEFGLAGCPPLLAFGVSMVGPVIYTFGNEEQKKRFLPDILDFNTWWCQGYSEPGSGSDLASLKTKAVKDGDDYIINGSKTWNTGIHKANYDMIFARTSGDDGSALGITCFLVPTNHEGFIVEEFLWTFNMPTDHALISLKNVWVPEQAIFGKLDRGLELAQHFVHENRIRQAASGVGAAQFCINESVKYAKERKPFGKPLSTNQAIQFPLAELNTECEMIRNLVYKTAWQMDQMTKPEVAIHLSDKVSMCNYRANRLVCNAADQAIQVHGGMGYSRYKPFEHIYRHHRRYRITEGSEEIQIRKVAGHLFKFIKGKS